MNQVYTRGRSFHTASLPSHYLVEMQKEKKKGYVWQTEEQANPAKQKVVEGSK